MDDIKKNPVEVIKHQQQIDDKTCTSACLVMITGTPIEEIIEEFHKDYLNFDILPSDFLEAKSFKVKKCYSENNILYGGKLYLITAPSLNVVAGIHHIVIDTRLCFSSDDHPLVFDPQKGREGQKYYVYINPQGSDEVKLRGYVIDLEVVDV